MSPNACFVIILGRHEAFLKSKNLQTLREPRAGKEFTFSKNELVKIEQSLKVCFPAVFP